MLPLICSDNQSINKVSSLAVKCISFYLKIIKFLYKDVIISLFCYIYLHCYVIIGLLKLNTYNLLFEI